MTMIVGRAGGPLLPGWRLAIALVVLAGLVALSVAYIYGKGLNGPPIRSDGFGYHAYLPALLIHHDVTFAAFVKSFPDGTFPPRSGIVWREEFGAFLNKYPIGVAVLAAPFFLVADFFVMVSGGARSGLSTPYQVANMVAGSTYFLLGIVLLWRVMLSFFAATVAAWTLAIVVFGTNVFHYASYDASFSHVYSWFLVAAFLLALVRYRERRDRGGAALLSGVLLGLIVITRVPNGILCVLAVAVWLDLWRRGILGRWALRDLALFSLGLVVALLPLVSYWYGATGRLVVYSYGDEGFVWTDPALSAFLFSVSKGLLFWAPLLILAVPGFFLIPAGLRPWFSVAAPIAVALQVYLCASWRPWDFGGSFGSRPFVEFMPILAVPIAASLSALRQGRLWLPARGVIVVFVALNLFLMHSYWRGFVPFSGTTVAMLADLPRQHLVLLGLGDDAASTPGGGKKRPEDRRNRKDRDMPGSPGTALEP